MVSQFFLTTTAQKVRALIHSSMKVSVVIPAFNEARLLGETLRHVQAALTVFTSRGWGVEIIVCDNNSTDATAEIARAAGATVVFEPENQIARARNSGAAAATGDWLIFVDAALEQNLGDTNPLFKGQILKRHLLPLTLHHGTHQGIHRSRFLHRLQFRLLFLQLSL